MRSGSASQSSLTLTEASGSYGIGERSGFDPTSRPTRTISSGGLSGGTSTGFSRTGGGLSGGGGFVSTSISTGYGSGGGSGGGGGDGGTFFFDMGSDPKRRQRFGAEDDPDESTFGFVSTAEEQKFVNQIAGVKDIIGF